MHPLLARQLKRFGASATTPPADWEAFLRAVAEAYGGFDDDRRLLERSMDLVSGELLEANQRAEAERNLLEQLFHEAPAAIALYHGADHVVTMANDQWRQLTGKRDPIGKRFLEVFPELASTELPHLLRRVLVSGERHLGVETLVPLDRTGTGMLKNSYWNFVWEPVRDRHNVVTDVFVHAVEVTDQVLARHRIEERAEEFRRLSEALERSNRELDQFAYVTSHDLKAPLRGIASLAQWVEEDLQEEMPEVVRDHLSLLKGRVYRMESLIDGILLYSRAGKAQNGVEPVDTGALVDELIDLLAPPPGISIVAKAPMPVLHAERVPLQQVLMNLVSNAVKHGAERTTRVEIQAREAGSFVEFCVSDDGPGIAPEYHQRIFGIFQRLDARDTVEGAGIGLALVKKIVETRGGKIWVESEPEAGCRFTFLWPMQGQATGT